MKGKGLFTKFLAILCGILGLSMLAFVFMPIVFYEITSPRYATYLSPIPENAVAAEQAVDYTKVSNWFPEEGSKPNFNQGSVYYYKLSIPKLGIKNASVAIGGEDLSKGLIQYPGTAVPGKPGNSVIFGHSILPQFFNPQNYMSIFSTLPTLLAGDEIIVEYDGVSYQYRVEDKFEVTPTDTQILQQNPTDSFLSLITCTPPGNPLRPRRLIVRARIVPLGERDFSI